MTPRANDKVYVWNNIVRVGVVKRIVPVETSLWFVDGMPGRTLKAEIKFPDSNNLEYHILSELRIHHRP
jgi:hypothetical protein